jgi:Domain of unknown function (DUF4432)
MRHTRRSILITGGLIAVLAASPLAPAQEPFRQVLISVSRDTDPNLIFRSNTASRDAVPECPVAWSVRKVRLTGGKQEGVDIVRVDNGKMQITLIPTRGMGIQMVTLEGKRILGWDSPIREVVHPSFINLLSRGGQGWLEGFNEWLCRCGMEWNGSPGIDRFVNSAGEETTMDLTLHGRIANLPAQEVLLIAERKPPYRITIRGRVDERILYGAKLELTTELSTVPGSREFAVRDAVTNRGGQRQEFEMLYHTNFGPPLLEEGSKLLAPVETVTPLSGDSAQDVERYDQFLGPTPGFAAQVYGIKPLADASGRTLVLLRNKAGDLGASMRYATRELPFLTVWKNTVGREDGYVVGIEPGTNFPNNRRVERKHGRVPSLPPGASHFMTIEYAVHSGAEAVEGAAGQVARIQGDRRPLINEKPEKSE